MKVGIITFHFVHNQGAVLQCYALQKYLQKQGNEVHVINYQPKYHTVRYKAWKSPFRYAKWCSNAKKKSSFKTRVIVAARSFVRCMIWNFNGKDRANEHLFSEFIKNHLNCTKKYETVKALQTSPPEMHAYISGSDQLWNPDLLNHAFDEAYFLKFGNADCKRIAYAISMGRELYEEEYQSFKTLSSELTALSFREKYKSVIEATGQDIHICIDPTLLLDEESYSAIEAVNKESEPYIFVYGLESSEDIRKAVELAAGKYQCKVINGSPQQIKLNDKNVECIYSYAPDQFLSYIKNAKCVVTNSFHGTAFSIIYKKKFITVPHTTRGKRMIELLGKLELNNALWGTDVFYFDAEIDYTKVYEKLQKLRENSAVYLDRALSGARNDEIPFSDENDVEKPEYS